MQIANMCGIGCTGSDASSQHAQRWVAGKCNSECAYAGASILGRAGVQLQELLERLTLLRQVAGTQPRSKVDVVH